MDKITPAGDETIVYQGRIFEITKRPMYVGQKTLEFETVRRAPGTRIIIVKDNSILITKEYRTELDDYAYRLPGGKVFDTLEDYKNAIKNDSDLLECAIHAAKKECIEETGLIADQLDLFKISKAGATVEWDLYYFITYNPVENENGQMLEAGEIIKPDWYSFEEVRQLCLDGKIKEDRTLGVLLTFLEKNK